MQVTSKAAARSASAYEAVGLHTQAEGVRPQNPSHPTRGLGEQNIFNLLRPSASVLQASCTPRTHTGIWVLALQTSCSAICRYRQCVLLRWC